MHQSTYRVRKQRRSCGRTGILTNDIASSPSEFRYTNSGFQHRCTCIVTLSFISTSFPTDPRRQNNLQYSSPGNRRMVERFRHSRVPSLRAKMFRTQRCILTVVTVHHSALQGCSSIASSDDISRVSRLKSFSTISHASSRGTRSRNEMLRSFFRSKRISAKRMARSRNRSRFTVAFRSAATGRTSHVRSTWRATRPLTKRSKSENTRYPKIVHERCWRVSQNPTR